MYSSVLIFICSHVLRFACYPEILVVSVPKNFTLQVYLYPYTYVPVKVKKRGRPEPEGDKALN
jgi:hypothetical protein